MLAAINIFTFLSHSMLFVFDCFEMIGTTISRYVLSVKYASLVITPELWGEGGGGWLNVVCYLVAFPIHLLSQ